MATITTRAGKGTPLTNTEVDDNFSNLNSAKYESGSVPTFGDVRIAGSSSPNLNLLPDGTVGNADISFDGTNFIIVSNSSSATMKFSTSSTERFRLHAGSGGAVFNENSNDYDFRVESNDNSNMLFVDAAANTVVIGGTVAETADTFEVIGSDATTNVRIRNTNAGDAGPRLIFDKASASPANDDNVGELIFIGKDSSGNAEQYARLLAESSNITSGAEDATVSLEMMVNGYNRQMYLHNHLGTVFNELSADLDFRVESDGNANMLFVDGGENRVGVGTGSVTAGFVLEGVGDARFADVAGDDAVEIGWSGGGGYAFVQAFDRAATAQRSLKLNSSLTINSLGSIGIGVADGDVTNDGTAARTYVGIIGTANRGRLNIGSTASNGADVGTLAFTNGANTLADISVDSSSGSQTVGTIFHNSTGSMKFQAANNYGYMFNEGGLDTDFRIESDGNTHALFVEASSGNIGINASTITGWASAINAIDFGGAFGGSVASLAQGSSPYGATYLTSNAYLATVSGDVTNNWKARSGHYASAIALNTDAVANIEFFKSGWTTADNPITWIRPLRMLHGESVFNEDSYNVDFRVESDTNTHAVFVDAENSRVGINNNAPSINLDVTGGMRSEYTFHNSAFQQTGGVSLNYWKIGRIGVSGPSSGELTMYGSRGSYSAGYPISGKTVFQFRGGTNATVLDAVWHSEGQNGIKIPIMGYVPIGSHEFDIYAQLPSYCSLENIVSTGGGWTESFSNTGSSSAPTGFVNVAPQFNVLLGNYPNLLVSQAAVILNEDSYDVDFRVETNNNTHTLYVNGGHDHVNIGTATDHGGVLNVETTGNNVNLVLACTDSGSNEGPILDLTRDAGNVPSDNDVMGAIRFRNDNTNLEMQNYARIEARAVDVSAGTEDGRLEFTTIVGGADNLSRLLLNPTETAVNDNSANLDFRVESDDYSHMLFVDAGANSVRVGSSGNDIPAHLEVKQSFSKSSISQQSTSVIAGSGQPAKYAEGVEAYDTTSSGTVLTIPITDQGNLHRQYIVDFMFCSGEYNSHSSAKAGTLKIGFTSLNTGPNALVVLEKTGNVASVSGNDSNLLITFSSGYTIGLSNYEGVICHYKVLGYSPEYLQMWNGTLN